MLQFFTRSESLWRLCSHLDSILQHTDGEGAAGIAGQPESEVLVTFAMRKVRLTQQLKGRHETLGQVAILHTASQSNHRLPTHVTWPLALPVPHAQNHMLVIALSHRLYKSGALILITDLPAAPPRSQLSCLPQ